MITTVGGIVVIILVCLAIYLIPSIPPLMQRVLYAIVVILFLAWIFTLVGILPQGKLP